MCLCICCLESPHARCWKAACYTYKLLMHAKCQSWYPVLLSFQEELCLMGLKVAFALWWAGESGS